MDRGLETANVLYCGAVRLHGLHVLVQDGEDLVVEDLVLSDAVGHFLQGLKTKKPQRKMYGIRIRIRFIGRVAVLVHTRMVTL